MTPTEKHLKQAEALAEQLADAFDIGEVYLSIDGTQYTPAERDEIAAILAPALASADEQARPKWPQDLDEATQQISDLTEICQDMKKELEEVKSKANIAIDKALKDYREALQERSNALYELRRLKAG